MERAIVTTIGNPLLLHRRYVESYEPGTLLRAALPRLWTAWTARVNGATVEGDYVLQEGDYVVAIRRPEGAGAILVNILISIAISAAFALLFPPPKPKRERDDESSPTYGFGGISNNRAEGQPIPVVYGRMKLGGTIANEFVDVEGIPPKSTLRQMISFGEGPIQAIGTVTEDTPAGAPLTGSAIPLEVEINGNPAQNFAEVKAWVRLGSNQQTNVPGFNEARQTFDVGTELTSAFEGDIPGSETAQLVPGFSINNDDEFTGVNDSFWDADAVSYDFSGEAVDGFVITLNFPQGLYSTNTSSGATENASLAYQVRYIELDGGGSPITSGGPNSDGYVRLPVEGPIALRQRSPFQSQVRGFFQDPQAYAPAVPGTALLTTTTSGSNASYATASGGYATGFEVPFWSGFAWVKIGASGEQNILSSVDVGADRGWQLRIAAVTFGNGETANVLQFRIGRGSRFITLNAGSFGGLGALSAPPQSFSEGLFDATAVGRWIHVGFAYMQNEYLYLCVNGRLISAIPSEFNANNYDLEWVRRPVLVGDDFAAMAVDEVKLYNAALGPDQFAADYGGGSGTIAPTLGLDGRMVFRSAFDDASGTSTFTSNNQWWGTTPTLNGGATAGTEPGIVRSGFTPGDLKRSKYRLEILRVSKTSNRSSVGNEVEVQDVQSILSTSLSYPNSPLLALEINATEQLNGGIPTTTAVAKGRKCPIWDGESLAFPQVRREWTANPAWIALDLVTERRFGLGRYYDLRSVDLPAVKSWADYCDEIVFDGQPRVTIDNTNGTGDADLLFDDSVTDATGAVRGALWFEINISDLNTIPDRWEVGYHLRLSGWPTDAETGVNNNVDSPDAEGYEIYSVELIAGVWTVKCYWDRLDETDPWTSGSRLGADILTPTDLDTAKVEGGERRFEFNGVFDKTQPAWNALLDVCAVGRGTPVPIGSTLSFRYSHPRAPIGLITRSNIIAETFTCDFASPSTRPNALTLSILDREQAFEPVPVQVQSDEIASTANQSFVRQENSELFGVTSFGQAERHGNFVLNVNQNQRRSGSFRAALDALPYQVGDLLRVSSEVLPRGASGRVAASSQVSEADILLDRQDFSGAAWTASGCTVTTNTATDPFGDVTADTLSGAGYVEQDLTLTDTSEGWVSVSCYFKDDSGGSPTLELVADRGSNAVLFDIGAATAIAGNDYDLQAKGHAQGVGGGWIFAEAMFFVKATDGGSTTSTLTMRVYPSRTAGSAFASKATATRAAHAGAFRPLMSVITDTETTIEAATSYTLFVQDQFGDVQSAALDTTLTPPGTYPPGSVLYTSGQFSSVPRRGNAYLLASSAEELIVEISGTSRAADLSANFEWVEYVGEVFADDAEESKDGSYIQLAPDQPTAPASAPPPPAGLLVNDGRSESGPGSYVLELTASWQHGVSGRDQIIGTQVYYRNAVTTGDVTGGWTLGAQVGGLTSTATWVVPGASVGDLIEVSAVPMSREYRNTPANSGTRTVHRVRGLAWNPIPVASVTGVVRDGAAVYGVTYDGDRDGADSLPHIQTEIRRGGWLLGQPVTSTARGGLIAGPTPDLFQAPGDASVGRLHARGRTTVDNYGAAATADVSLAPPGGTDAPDLGGMDPEVEWETYTSGGWVTAFPAFGDPTVNGLAENADGELEFDGSDLSGTFTTSYDANALVSLNQSRQPRALYVMAAVEAEQVHPKTLAGFAVGLGSLEAQRWSLEGPTSVGADDLPNSTLEIEINVNEDGTADGWTGWQHFKPGLYDAVDVRFRLSATRPTTDYQIRIKRFHSKVVVPRRTLVQQGTRDLLARQEII